MSGNGPGRPCHVEGGNADECVPDAEYGELGGDGGGDGGSIDVKVADGGIGVVGIRLPGIVFVFLGGSLCFSFASDLFESTPASLTFLIAPRVCLYACINARQAPDIERMADRKNMTSDWKENVRCGGGT